MGLVGWRNKMSRTAAGEAAITALVETICTALKPQAAKCPPAHVNLLREALVSVPEKADGDEAARVTVLTDGGGIGPMLNQTRY